MVDAILECPVCNGLTLEVKHVEMEIPHFGNAIIYTAVCSNCGYKTNDIKFKGNFPIKNSLHIEKPEDMKIKIVRGNEGTVEIPELGLLLEPGPLAESFITNIEGLLERFEEVLPLFDKKVTEELQNRLNKAKDGKLRFTIIIDDPSGVSHFIRDEV